jgi:hypothetical protein
VPTIKPSVPAKVEVEQPITIRAIEWKRLDADSPLAAVRVRLECVVLLDRGQAPPGLLRAFGREDDSAVTLRYQHTDTADLKSHADLAFGGARENLEIDLDLLKQFIKLGTNPDVAAKLDELIDDPEQEPVVLRTGTLAALLEYGMTPTEIWTFVLNHGGAWRKLTPLSDPWLKNKKKREQLKTAIERFTKAAKALRKVQSMDMTEALAALGNVRRIELIDPADHLSGVKTVRVRPADASGFGPHPALAPGRSAALIAELELIAGQLKSLLPPLSRSPGRPTKAIASEFCRDWYNLAKEHSGHPLYEQGAALYALVFDRKPNPASFESLCRRARRANKNISAKST